MKKKTTKPNARPRHRPLPCTYKITEICRELDKQQLRNCALLVAYVYGRPGGWYGICHGKLDGYPNDYAYVHHNSGSWACHHVRAFYTLGDITDAEQAELDQVRNEVAREHHLRVLPLVATLADDHVSHAVSEVHEAYCNDAPEDGVAWLRELCGPLSDLSRCDWSAALSEVVHLTANRTLAALLGASPAA